MNIWKAAALTLGGWCVLSTAVALFTGRFIDDWRDHCAEYAKRQQFQQFDVEPRYVAAEWDRIATELESQP